MLGHPQASDVDHLAGSDSDHGDGAVIHFAQGQTAEFRVLCPEMPGYAAIQGMKLDYPVFARGKLQLSRNFSRVDRKLDRHPGAPHGVAAGLIAARKRNAHLRWLLVVERGVDQSDPLVFNLQIGNLARVDLRRSRCAPGEGCGQEKKSTIWRADMEFAESLKQKAVNPSRL
jgi:hypothetical protein